MTSPGAVTFTLVFRAGTLEVEGAGESLADAVKALETSMHDLNPDGAVLASIALAAEVADLLDAWGIDSAEAS